MKNDTPAIDIDKIMERIRAEIELRKMPSPDAHEKLEQSVETVTEDVLVEKTEMSEEGERSIEALCRYQDGEFLVNAYRVLFQRDLGADDMNIWLPRFRAGELTKKEILALLRYGAEGRKKKVAIKGLLVPFVLHRLFKVPILGRILRIFSCVVHLPVLFRNIQGLQFTVNSRLDQLNNRLVEVENNMHAALAQKADWAHVSSLNVSMHEMDTRLHETATRLHEMDTRLYETATRLHEMDTRLHETDTRLSTSLQEEADRIQETKRIFQDSMEKVVVQLAEVTRQARDSKFHVLAQQRRLDDLFQQGHINQAEAVRQVESQRTKNNPALDAMYVAFEDRFRGTREDIKERQSVYLPYVEKVQKKIEGGLVLDVGCGRGEWLELLAKDGYVAKGVDLNRMMVVQSRELGLNVVEGDVFDYFIDMESESLSVVTGFHIVEHLPLKTMIALFDQAYRVLKPGGMVIFETPNPENIIVGSCNFYYDPTHRNPIPPEALKFLLEARGYQDLEILRLHENEDYADLKVSNLDEKIASRFYGAQDYSVIGYKR